MNKVGSCVINCNSLRAPSAWNQGLQPSLVQRRCPSVLRSVLKRWPTEPAQQQQERPQLQPLEQVVLDQEQQQQQQQQH